MLYYNINDLSEQIDCSKTNNSKDCIAFTFGLLIVGSYFKIVF